METSCSLLIVLRRNLKDPFGNLKDPYSNLKDLASNLKDPGGLASLRYNK
jgi:hypothetical protein